MTKRKKIIIIVISILAALGLIAGVVLLVINLNKSNDPLFKMSNTDYLTYFGEWEAVEDERIVWTFNDDGSGKLTTNGGIDEYEFAWEVNGSELKIVTQWFYPIEDDFSLTTNRDEETFTIVDTAEDKITTFQPKVYITDTDGAGAEVDGSDDSGDSDNSAGAETAEE